jgi:hypothetical protein
MPVMSAFFVNGLFSEFLLLMVKHKVLCMENQMAYSPEITARTAFARRNTGKKEASALTEANDRPVFSTGHFLSDK